LTILALGVGVAVGVGVYVAVGGGTGVAVGVGVSVAVGGGTGVAVGVGVYVAVGGGTGVAVGVGVCVAVGVGGVGVLSAVAVVGVGVGLDCASGRKRGRRKSTMPTPSKTPPTMRVHLRCFGGNGLSTVPMLPPKARYRNTMPTRTSSVGRGMVNMISSSSFIFIVLALLASA
jgi:hypothetical protein